MIPGFCLTRLNQRYQEESMTCAKTCTKACKNCTCNSPYESDYVEIDPSPLATQARKMFEERK